MRKILEYLRWVAASTKSQSTEWWCLIKVSGKRGSNSHLTWVKSFVMEKHHLDPQFLYTAQFVIE